MVRGRRVRAVVPCTRGDGCCSPKRKDQRLDFTAKISHAVATPKSRTMTHFFQVVDVEADKPQLIEYTPTRIVSLRDDGTPNGRNDDDYYYKSTDKGTPLSNNVAAVPSPGTPHRIELCTESGSSATSALSQLRIAPPLAKRSAPPKGRKKLNQNQIVVGQPSPAFVKEKSPIVQSTLTAYFPVRRSVRKTSKKVLEEQQETLERCVRNNVEDGLEIHNFEGKGRGVVTSRAFAKGEFVVEYAGVLIDMVEAKRREKNYSQDQNTGCYMYYFKHKNQQYCVDATAESGRLGRLVNHSRNGNLVTRTVLVNNVPRLILVAKDDLEAGSEVTYDYGDRSKVSLLNHPWLAL